MRNTALSTKPTLQEALQQCSQRFADGLIEVIQHRFRQNPKAFMTELFLPEVEAPVKLLPAPKKLRSSHTKTNLRLVSSRPMKLLPPARSL